MINRQWQFVFFGMFAAFTSCNVVRYVGVNNHLEEAREVMVGFAPSNDIMWESDTLLAGAIGADTFSTYIIRRNLSSNSYTFRIPENTHVELMPKGLDNPFVWVKIVSGPDTLHYNLRNKDEVKRLKREKIIETSGVPESMFLINIGKPE